VRAADASFVPRGRSPEEAARDRRYAFLEEVADAVGATRIATGHTLDDRVETTLARLIHGAGTEGLAGIPPAEGARIRPLIEVRRAEARAYCEDVGLTFYDDPANSDDRFERPAVRHKIVAAIEERWGEGAVRAMAKSADRLNDDAAALRSLGDALFPQISTRRGADVVFKTQSLKETPRALRRRVLASAVGRVRDRAGGIEAAVDALEGRIEGNRAYAVASGIEIAVSADEVVVRHQEATD
jgi:tRNA(Ile)-lysidine synthase